MTSVFCGGRGLEPDQMWQFTEEYEAYTGRTAVYAGDRKRRKSVLARDDGVRAECFGIGREGQRRCRYVGNDLVVYFDIYRSTHENGAAGFKASLGAIQEWLNEDPTRSVPRRLLPVILEDIEQALLNWPEDRWNTPKGVWVWIDASGLRLGEDSE